MVRDVLGVVDHAGLERFALLSASHSGWVAMGVHQRLGERVPKIVHMDWLVEPPSAAYMDVIRQLQVDETWEHGRDTLFAIWRGDLENPDIDAALEVMWAQEGEMWKRSGREIERAFQESGSPLVAWSKRKTPPDVVHVYGQPFDPAYLRAQESFAGEHDWFTVVQVPARSHFTMIETPDRALEVINAFLD